MPFIAIEPFLAMYLLRFFDILNINSYEPPIFFDETNNNEEDFDFNQDLDDNDNFRSPGWIRYQKRIK